MSQVQGRHSVSLQVRLDKGREVNGGRKLTEIGMAPLTSGASARLSMTGRSVQAGVRQATARTFMVKSVKVEIS